LAKRILIIDDDPVILDAVKTILEDMGHRVDGYTSSTEGEQAALSQHYDLILMDLRMPVKDGAAVTASILANKTGSEDPDHHRPPWRSSCPKGVGCRSQGTAQETV
jgi:CheY-like chemotaxis protein